MKILITGSKGMLGRDIAQRFSKEYEIVETDVEELDITDRKAVFYNVKKIRPNYIINCAAYTQVDNAEECYEIANKLNYEGAKNLAQIAKRVNAKLIHISTDYVFKGDLDIAKEYFEDDIKNPETVYGQTKLKGEIAIQENTSEYYIFRTAWLYGAGGNNFVKTITKLASSRNEIDVVSDQYGSPTYTKDLAEIIIQALKKQIPYGVYNATNLGYTTWYEFAKEIINKQNLNCRINAITTSEYLNKINKTQAKRPLNSKLSKNKLKCVGIEIPDWREALERYLQESKNI